MREEEMADDYDNTDEVANLSDDELRTLVRTRLNSQLAFDGEDLSVHVRNGQVTVSGRVGTESELRIVDHVLTDSLGLVDVDNQVVMDDLVRAESPEAIDEHLVDERERSGILLGDEPSESDDEAEHIALDKNRNPRATHDVHEAIEEGEPWIPPEGPTPEGVGEERE
ncbi:MAG TPA: BON domain-containing protein [Gemmatimonadaceae bacterium]